MKKYLSLFLIIISAIIVRPQNSEEQILIIVAGSIVLFKFVDIAIYWFESELKVKYVVIAQNIAYITFIFIKIILLIFKMPLEAFIITLVAEFTLTAFMLASVMQIKGIKWQLLKLNLNRAKELAVESWPLMLSGFAIMIYVSRNICSSNSNKRSLVFYSNDSINVIFSINNFGKKK